MTNEEQFNFFFPALNEENWKDVLNKRYWHLEDMLYLLKVENNTGYAQDCHFCG